MGQGCERDVTPAEGGGQPVEIECALAGTRYHLDGGAGQLAHLEQSQVVAVVGDPVGQQALALADPAAQGEPPQGLGPSLGVGAGHHHVTVPGADQPGRRGAERGQPPGHHGRRLVPSPFRLQPQVLDHGPDGGRGGQGRSGVVEVGDRGAPRRQGAFGFDIDGPVTRNRWLRSRGANLPAERQRGIGAIPGRVGRVPESFEPLLESHADPDPLVQFGRWFDDAAVVVPNPEAMAVASVGRDGRPSVRMVLLKSWGEDGFVFHTNYDSRKGRELAEDPHAALLFYWEPMGRQVRIEGAVERTSEEESDAYFATRPRGGQIGAYASHQSEVVGSRVAARRRGERPRG